jgi:hypothetical protein
VQSTYLWAKSSLNEQIPSDPGMPYLGKFQIVHLRNPEMRYVALLGETPDAVQQGLRALTEAKVGYHLLSTRDLNSGAIHVYWQLVEVTARPPDTVESGNK